MVGNLTSKIKAKFWSKFTNWCHQAVILGYQNMRNNAIDYQGWEEEDISAALYIEMKKLPAIKLNKISIFPEFRLYNEATAKGINPAKKADRIDFQFTRWKSKKETIYFGEAKNLSSRNWSKTKGSKVDASAYRARYIDTGIDRVVYGKYSFLTSFLIGYVVNGTATENIIKLNLLIKKRNLPPKIGYIKNPIPICSYTECYSSVNFQNNTEVILQHIFLEFDQFEIVPT